VGEYLKRFVRCVDIMGLVPVVILPSVSCSQFVHFFVCVVAPCDSVDTYVLFHLKPNRSGILDIDDGSTNGVKKNKENPPKRTLSRVKFLGPGLMRVDRGSPTRHEATVRFSTAGYMNIPEGQMSFDEQKQRACFISDLSKTREGSHMQGNCDVLCCLGRSRRLNGTYC
jgi:hypothetical protein